jgi:hypothetical protein
VTVRSHDSQSEVNKGSKADSVRTMAVGGTGQGVSGAFLAGSVVHPASSAVFILAIHMARHCFTVLYHCANVFGLHGSLLTATHSPGFRPLRNSRMVPCTSDFLPAFLCRRSNVDPYVSRSFPLILSVRRASDAFSFVSSWPYAFVNDCSNHFQWLSCLWSMCQS